MMAPIAQITAWRLWRRNRFLLLFLLAHLAVVTLISYTILRGKPLEYRGWCVLSLAYSLQFLLPMFTYVDGDFDLADPNSKFPAHLFTLPLRTNQFIFWPMCYGTVCFAAIWVYTSCILPPPLGIALPRFWPAAALAALIASLQTVVWCPLGFPFARIALALAFPGGILAAAGAGFVLHIHPAALLALFLLLIPLCYLISVRGLAAERRGDSPDWRFSLSSILPTKLFPQLLGRKSPKPFRSPQAAQLWLEWHRNGVTNPLLMLLIAGGFGILGFFIRQPALLGVGEIQVSLWVKSQLVLLLVFPLMFGQSAGAD